MKLAGKVAIVTGGGRGIGRSTALALAAEGASVIVAARTISEIEEVARAVRDLGQHAVAVQADVSLEEDVANMVSRAIETFERVDILVNNAAANLPDRHVVDLTLAEWNRLLNVNLTGPFLCSRAVLPTMMKQRSGRSSTLLNRRSRWRSRPESLQSGEGGAPQLHAVARRGGQAARHRCQCYLSRSQ